MTKMQRVVVTGATGFIGFHLIKTLACNGREVYAVCREGSLHCDRLKGISGVKIIFCNLENIDTLPQIIGDVDFDVFFHMAWENASGRKRADYGVQVNNIAWSLGVVSAAEKLNCKKIVSVGTVCENQCDYIKLQDKFLSASYYLSAKKTTHEMMRYACLEKNIPFVWLTFYHPIGAYNKTDQLMANTILKLYRNEATKFGSCNQLFDVIAVEDLARAICLTGQYNLKEDTYFIGSGKPRRLKDYLSEVRDIVAPNIKLGFGEYDDNHLPMRKEWLTDSKFNEETGFCPEVNFKESVRRTFEYVKTIE